MTGSRARSLTVTLVLIAACAQRSGGSGANANKLDQTQQAESGGITPVACPPSPANPFTTDAYDQCSMMSAPAGTQAVSAEFLTVGYDSTLPLGDEVVKEVAQTFQVKTPNGAYPGSIGLILKLLTPTSGDSLTNVLIVDVIGPLPNDPTTGEPVVPPSGANGANDPSDLENFQPLLAEGRYNTADLQYDVDTPVQINFQYNKNTPNVGMQVGQTYAVVFYMQAPSLNQIGIAANADTEKWYCTVDPATGTVDHDTTPGVYYGTCAAPSVPIGYGWTRQERMESAGTPTNPPWVQDAIADLNFYTTVNDGCLSGANSNCGTGICYRTIAQCDSFGNFNVCFANYCTTSADCVLNFGAANPIPSGAQCNNPTGQPNAGSCDALPETCNGYDDDCDGVTDNGLGFTSCGTGGCSTSVYNCVVQTGNTAACTDNQGSNQYSCIQSATNYGVPTVCSQYQAAPSAEICNGIDDNCNGITDEGLTDTVSCGFGACQRVAYSCTLQPGTSGTEACDSGAAAAAAEGEPYYCLDESTQYGQPVGPSPDTFQCTPDYTQQIAEVCNDVDDDCDGYTDNAKTGVGPGPTLPGNAWKLSQYYYPTGALGQPAAPTSVSPALPNTSNGNCRFGVEYCSSTVVGVASWDPVTAPALAAVTPIAESPGNDLSDPIADYLCNGQDDDCDGYTDNWPQNQPLAMNRSYWPVGLAGQGIGACQNGLETCDDWFNPPGDTGDGGTYAPYPGDPYTGDSRDPQYPQWAISVNPTLPSGEICNGVDDNCNGLTDEGLGSTTCGNGVCATTVQNCEYVNDSDAGILGYETLVDCKYGGFTNLGNTAADSPEVCNGLDDNCDGFTDNLEPDQPALLVEQCNPGCAAYNADAGATICQYPYGNAQGECRYGTAVCLGAAGYSTVCGSGGQAELTPSNESCNGLDDDCDGFTDNIALSGHNGGLMEDCGTAIGQCRGGTATCGTPYNAADPWSACGGSGYVGPTAEVCNDLDDDCDGYTDNETTGSSPLLWVTCDPLCVAWNTTGQGSTDHDTCTPGVGQCVAGTQTCDSAASKASPTYYACGTETGATETGPSAELCNGLDDDCDGYTDNNPNDHENYSLTNTAYDAKCGATYGTPDCVEGRGQCHGGTEACGVGGWVAATPDNEVGPTPEICNDLDDDCDGYTDNTSTGSPALLAVSCDPLCVAWNNTGQGHTDGDTCTPGVGECKAGTQTCDSAESTSSPTYYACGTETGATETGPTVELCNNLDDDCDGYTDNNPTSKANNTLTTQLNAASTVLCTDGPSLPTPLKCAGPNVGQCKAGTQTCEAGATWTTLPDAGEIGPTTEVCNGLDDDCDGITDNLPSGVDQAMKQTCGVGGSCGVGITCTPGMLIEPTTNCCNGQDDPPTITNCGSAVLGGTCDFAPGVGQCAGGNAGSQTCLAGKWGNCTGGTGPTVELCNGLDDDCDGYTDNWVTYEANCTTTGACMCPIVSGSTNPTAQCTSSSNGGTPGFTQIGVNTQSNSSDTCLNVLAGCRVAEGTEGQGQAINGGGCDTDYYDFDGNFCDGCEAYDLTDHTYTGYTAEGATCVQGVDISSGLASGSGTKTITGTIISTTDFTAYNGTSETTLNGHNYYYLTVDPPTAYGTKPATCGAEYNWGSLGISITGTPRNGGTYVFMVYSSSCGFNSATPWVNGGLTEYGGTAPSDTHDAPTSYYTSGSNPPSGTGNTVHEASSSAVAVGSSTCSSGGWMTSFNLADTQSDGQCPYQTRTGTQGWTPVPPSGGAAGQQGIWIDVFKINDATAGSYDNFSYTATTGDEYTLTITH